MKLGKNVSLGINRRKTELQNSIASLSFGLSVCEQLFLSSFCTKSATELTLTGAEAAAAAARGKNWNPPHPAFYASSCMETPRRSESFPNRLSNVKDVDVFDDRKHLMDFFPPSSRLTFQNWPNKLERLKQDPELISARRENAIRSSLRWTAPHACLSPLPLFLSVIWWRLLAWKFIDPLLERMVKSHRNKTPMF